MPDTISIALGGGSLVKFNEKNEVTIGPQSVGYKLQSEAICFGGHTLTTTDIAVAAGYATIEGADLTRFNLTDDKSSDPSKFHLTKEQIQAAVQKICEMCEEVID